MAIKILDYLEAQDNITVRLYAYGSRSNYDPPDRMFKGGLVSWNVYDWTQVVNEAEELATFSTPSIALIHELGHAYQYFYYPDIRKLMKKGRHLKDAQNLEIEAQNLMMHERPVAIELGECYRDRYTDSTKMTMEEQKKKGLQQF
jgi:hypothetical protein